MKSFFRRIVVIFILFQNLLPFGQLVYAETNLFEQEIQEEKIDENTPDDEWVIPEGLESNDETEKQEELNDSTQEELSEDETITEYYGDGAAFDSLDSNVQPNSLVPEPTPVVTIDYVNETIIGFESTSEYTLRYGTITKNVSNQSTYKIESDMFSKVWRVVKKGDSTTTEDSEEQWLTIGGKPQLPEDWISVIPESEAGKKDGQLKGGGAYLQCRIQGDTNWIIGTKPSSVENLVPGIYEVRLAASNDRKTFASGVITKEIEAALPRKETPSLTIDYEKETLNGFDRSS